MFIFASEINLNQKIMEKITICYNSSAVKLKDCIDEVNDLILDVAKDWDFSSHQVVTNFTEGDNFFIRVNLLDYLDVSTVLLTFACTLIKSLNRFILSDNVNFVVIN